MNLNISRFTKTVEAAKKAAPQMARQIEAAAENMMCNPFIADDNGGLLILSDSGQTYWASSRGNKCQCKAHDFHQVCWHRLADRLYRLYQRGN